MQSNDATFEFDACDDASRHYWYLAETPRPPHATTQWLAFRFRFLDLSRHSPGSHFAIVLRARLGFDADGKPVSICGRGMTLGDTSQAQPGGDAEDARARGYGGAPSAQAESYWPHGNFLYRDSAVMPEGIADGIWHRVWLHVNDARWIAFGIGRDVDSATGTEVSACVQDHERHPVPSDASGVLIALGRGASETGPWRAEFRDIATGWF